VTDATAPLLDVQHLSIGFDHGPRTAIAVDDVSLFVRQGETLGLVGESGSGKSLTAYSILRLVRAPGRVLGGSVRLRGRDLMTLTEEEMCAVRGAEIGLVFQEPMTALNPVFTIGDQIAEALVVHGRGTWKAARATAVDLLDAVRLADASRRARDYPHQLSGGQRQRAMIAIALACQPPLLIADEPTTALDVTIQAEILELLRDMKQRFGLSLILITHDLGVVAEMADRVAVMYAGRIVEQAPVGALFGAPQHPYTRGLLASIPRAGTGRRLAAIDGAVPTPGHALPGCAFEPRCTERFEDCRATVPTLYPVSESHAVRCLLYRGARR
jgi:oligopeptide/dipeptide ABC transporter ATP-binding protein